MVKKKIREVRSLDDRGGRTECSPPRKEEVRVMKHWMVLGLMVMFAGPALADPTADARGVEDAFARACGAGDLKGVMALYADDAIAVWPGQGAEAKGKADIEKMAAALCKEGSGAQFTLKSLEALPLGDAHIVTVAHWESTLAGPGGRRGTTRGRSTQGRGEADRPR